MYDGTDYKTIVLYSWTFGRGGAHGSTTRKYLTFGARTGEKYRIDFFLKDIPDYKNRINEYLIKRCEVAIQEHSYYLNLSYVPLKFDGTENFGFEKDNNKLIIEYGEYSLSDYATWKCEGTYFVSEDVIYLDLNTENNSDSILFWRNGEMEVAYLDVETETIHYRTIWSAENDEVVYCNFR